ncbi:MAG TPA: bifunctional diguanylate cyclase/phosphodiesterase, partial [Candidatus Limiplasma sp.]|nr:bifunctional diguanylate cyclase/phosphodiesterase [Candidatus Limiplasma sp.]
YGYSMGDKLLKWHARQVKAGFADNGVVARLGSDEFAYAIKGAYTDDDLFHIAQHVLDACQSPLYVDEYVLNITVSAGVSMFPQCASDAASLLKNADIAMHHAKSDPSDRHIARYMDIDEAVKRKFLIAKHLKTARFDQELLLNFQPQFRIWDRVLIGMEALLRWSCPEIGDVAPSEFIPIAEEENMIIPIGNWVMNHAIQQIARWNTAYHTDLRMGINISPKQLDQAGTMEELRKSIAEYQAHPRWIDIEITENVALDNEDSAEKIKSHFQNKGISVSIDDFGTGYSSLGYLSILSFDRLKIAKPLIDKITFDESSRKIVMSIVLLAKSLGLMTISEGVETKEQFDLLRELGCDQIQGYYLGRPVPAAEFETTYLQPYLQKHGKDHPEDKP